MAWQAVAVTILRSMIDDSNPDSQKYDDCRLTTTLLVAAQQLDVTMDFMNDYSIDFEQSTLTPDPTETATKEDVFVVLMCLKASCIIIGNEVKINAGNAISIKDAQSSIDMRGVAGPLITLLKVRNQEYEQAVLDYRAGNSIAGQSILGPYSPGGWMIQANYADPRDGSFISNGY